MPDILTDKDLLDLQTVAGGTFDFTCTVERGVSNGTDGDGHPLPPIWTPNLANQACGLVQNYTPSGRTEGKLQNVNDAYEVDRYLITFPVGTDVLTGDRVKSITDRAGRLFDATAPLWEIKDRVPRYAYLAFILQAVR